MQTILREGLDRDQGFRREVQGYADTADGMLRLTEALIAETRPATVFVTRAPSEAARLADRIMHPAGQPAVLRAEASEGCLARLVVARYPGQGAGQQEGEMAELEVRDLSYRYGAKQALEAVSFTRPEGSFCALLGPNGAGKSTLVALLTRLLVAPEGRIAIAGHDLEQAPRRALANLGVVFQQPTLDLNLTVRQNMRYFAALHGLPRKGLDAAIDAALDRLNMAERAAERVAALNGGHRRRMELARALLHRPRVLLLDEPTVGLDAAARAAIVAHVHDLADEGLCVLWATHLTDEVRDADHLLVLHEGRILADGITREICGRTPLLDWFLDRTGAAA